MKKIRETGIILVAVVLSCVLARAETVTWTGDVNSSFNEDGNWSTGSVPADGDVANIESGTVNFSSGESAALNALRLRAGILNLSGGTLKAAAHSAWDSWVGGDSGKTATLTQTGGTFEVNELELGRNAGSNGIYRLRDGELNIIRGVNGYSLYIGGNKSGVNGGVGTLRVYGGDMVTRTGVKLGDDQLAGTGSFTVLGSSAARIGIGSHAGIDGWWEQYAGSTLRAGIDAGGVTKIFIDDVEGEENTYARFEGGALLDVDYYNDGAGGGTWTVLEVENGPIIDNGLAFDASVDTDIWSFNIDNSGANGRLTVTAAGEPANQILLQVGNTRRQVMKYGLDYERLWFWYGSTSNKNRVAQWSVVDCDIDYMRVAINCAYELTEGDYDLDAYTSKIIPMMRTMQAANPDVKFFASPRPLNEAISGARWQPYPRWITGDNGSSFDFDWEKCAEYLLRYLRLMDANGFKIHYLDVTNEWNYIEPREVKYIRNYLIDNLPAGMDVPLIVAPSTWSFTQGVSWLNRAQSQNVLSGFQIAASHNTGRQGTPQDFADKATELGKEIWDSEVHGWKGKTPDVEIPNSFQMFDRIRAGFTGLDAWLTIGTTAQQHCFILNSGSSVTRNVKYYIFRKLCNTSNYGHAYDINQPSEFTSTAALIRDDLLTVWVLNNEADTRPIRINVGNRRISDSDVRLTRWNESLALQGVGSIITACFAGSVDAVIEGNSLYCFEITLGSAGADFPDCNQNGVHDECDIANGTSRDRDSNGIPDECGTGAHFIRGDVNADGRGVDLSDAIYILQYLFDNGPEPACLDTADANDDSSLIDLSDAITVLQHLFADGGPLPEPFGQCGPDETDDAFGCASFPPCEP